MRMIQASCGYIYGDRDGDVWAGTNGEGLLRFKGRSVRMFTTENGLPSKKTHGRAFPTRRELMGGHELRLFRFADNRFTQFGKGDGLGGRIVRGILAAKDGSLWIATDGGVSHMVNGHFRN